MKRQKIRKAIILITLLLFPVLLNYFSPALIIEGASKGIIVGSFIYFAALFVSSLLLGRAYCGWVCPGAGLQECCFMVQNKKARGGRLDWIKYFIWVPWIGIITTAAVSAGGFHEVRPFYLTDYGVSVTNPENYVILYTVIGTIVVLSFAVGRRAFCHYVCWMAPFMVIGTTIRNIFGWPSLHLSSDKSKCKDCMTCSEGCPMSLDVNGMVQSGSMKNSECILCGTCVDNCPNKAIRYAFFG